MIARPRLASMNRENDCALLRTRWKFPCQFYRPPVRPEIQRSKGNGSNTPLLEKHRRGVLATMIKRFPFPPIPNPVPIREKCYEWKCRTCARDWPARFSQLSVAAESGARRMYIHARGRRNSSGRNGWSGRGSNDRGWNKVRTEAKRKREK